MPTIASLTRPLKRIVPRRVLKLAAPLARRYHLQTTRAAWHRARASPCWLGLPDLERLQARYPFRRDYRYDQESTLQRGQQRADQILELPGVGCAHSFLEVACSDGMVSAMLQQAGRMAMAIDRRRTGFDMRAVKEGTALLQMDAEGLALADGVFDCAFSYNSFEHFQRPDLVLQEMTRVVKPGGSIYLRFGPLYYSPWGEHAYRTVTVPYCQFLFTQAMMNDYAVAQGLEPIDFCHVNRWPIARYRALWTSFADRLDIIEYEERRDHSCLEIVREYAGCLKAHSEKFDDFLVSHISVLFRRRSSGAGSGRAGRGTGVASV